MALDPDPAGGFRTKDKGSFWFGSDANPDAVVFDTDGNARFAGSVETAVSTDVTLFGAVGDGVADDTEAFQDAIDSLTGGGVVRVPAGTYKLTDAVTLADNVIIRGAGKAVTIIQQSSTTAHAFVGTNTQFSGLEDLMVDGPGSGSGRGVNIDRETGDFPFYCVFRSVMIRRFGSHGVYVESPVMFSFYDVTSKENGGDGFSTAINSAIGTSTNFYTCYAHDNTSGNGFRLNNLYYSNLVGCGADGNVNGYKTENAQGVVFSGCGAEANGVGIQVNTSSEGVVLTGCWITNSTTSSIQVIGNSTGTVITGCSEGEVDTATSFISVTSGSEALIQQCSHTTANSLAGTVTVLDTDGNVSAGGAALGVVTPATHGLTAWSFDPVHAVNSSLPTNGTVYLVGIYPAADATITKIYWHVAVAGATPTANQNWVGLYDSTGALLASADVDDSVTDTGVIETTVSATAVTAGSMYWVAMLFNASTGPTISRATGLGSTSELANVGLSAASYRFATNGTSRTTLASTITPANNTGTAFAGPWVAIGP